LLRFRQAALATIALPLLLGARNSLIGRAPPSVPTFAAFVDGYLHDFARRHPSIAAGNGIHDFDGTLDDFSAAAIAREISELKAARTALRGFSAASLTPDERVDRRILDGVIDGWLLEQETLQNWKRNPMIYASALSDGIHNLMTMESAPAAERLRHVISKLNGVPVFITTARTNIANPPKLFAERGVVMMRGASAMIANDLPVAFAALKGTPLMDSLSRAVTTAKPVIDAYATYLEHDVVPNATGDFTIGAAAVARRYRGEELIDIPLDEMVKLGERELASQQAAFAVAAARISSDKKPLDVWLQVRRNHPKRGEVVAAAQRTVDSLTAFVRAKGIAMVPANERVIVQPAPVFDLGFASMHASPPLEKTPVKSIYYITDARADMTDAEAEAWLERFSYAGLVNTSAHEAMPGHWLHSIYMRQTPGKVRRIWIGLNPFPQPSSGQDGWAHYAEQLVVDQGYANGDPQYQLAQLSDALTRICRLLSGIKVHSHQWTLDQAQQCFEKDAYVAAPAAKREAERAAYDPTYGGYFLGKMGILTLRRDVEARDGRAFNLRSFHEHFMTDGIAPIWAHRQLLLPGDTRAVIH
ncbi:MAG: DUF885 domain-containing protein, partial [Gemmatimonadota bacterium]|nr:DUF885 domain-containing protein [Gemmatimonadota bacterium]